MENVRFKASSLNRDETTSKVDFMLKNSKKFINEIHLNQILQDKNLDLFK